MFACCGNRGRCSVSEEVCFPVFFEHRHLSRLWQGGVVFWYEIPLSSEFFDEDKRHGVQPTYKKVKGFQPLQLTSI